MTDDTNHPAEDEPSAENKTPTSRRTFMKAAGASAGTYALGSSAASAQDVPELTVDLADDEIDVGGTTTATFTIENVPEGSSGASIEISLDDDTAAIVEIQDNSFARTINNEIEQDYDGAAPSLGFGDAGGISSGDVLGTLVIEGQDDGDTPLELTDFSLTDADTNVIETVDYAEPTLTVGDGDDNGGSGGVSAPANVEVVETDETWVDLEWSAVDDAASYNVYVDGVLETETTSTGTTVTDLESGETYEIGVSAVAADGEESDQETVVAMTDGGGGTPVLTVDVADTQIDAGETTTVDLALEPASDGLFGFAFELQFDSDVVSAVDAEIGSRFPGEDDILTQVDVGDDYVDLRSQQAIEPDNSGVHLGQVTLEGDGEGRSDLDVDVGMMTDYDDDDFMPETQSASLTVGESVPPTVTIDAADEIGVGDQTTVELALDPASDGLYGFATELQFDGDVVSVVDAEIGGQFPDEDDILTQVDVGDDYVDLRSQESIAPDESGVTLGRITLEGDSTGQTSLEVDPGFFTNYDDEDFEPETESATLDVSGGFEAPTVTIDAPNQIDVGDQTTVELALDPASDGLYGFATELQFDSDVVSVVDAEIGGQFPDEDDILTQVDVGDDYVDLRSQESIEPTDSSVTLGQVTLEGDTNGETDLEVDPGFFTDYDDEDFTPATESASLTVGEIDGVPTVTVDAPEDLGVGETATVDIELDPASDGLYGFAAELQFDGDVVTAVDAEIGGQFPGEDDILTQIDVGDDYVDLRSQESIEPTDSSVTLGQVTLEGDAEGQTSLEVDPGFFTDYDDEDFEPATESASLTVGEIDGIPTVTLDVDETDIDDGDRTTVDLALEPASDGLYGFAVELQLDGDTVTPVDAEIGGQFPDESDILTQIDVGDDYVDLRSQESIEPTDSAVHLGQVTLEGDGEGPTTLEVDPGFFTDYDDEDFEPATESATIDVGEGGTSQETITVDVADSQIDTGDRTTVDLALDPASDGLFGFAVELQFDGDVVSAVDADIGGQFPDESDILTQIDVGDDYVDLRSQEAIEPTDMAVALGQITLEGDANGDTDLDVDVGFITDYDDEDFEPETESATLVVDGEELPDPPENLSVDETDENSITVSWTGDASEYNVYVGGDFDSSTSGTSATITGLESDTTYRIGVASVADGMESSTETVTATTDEEGPGEGNYEQWQPDELYQEGERVSWNGEDWEAKWTNRGEEPEYDEWGAWEPVDGEIPLQQDLAEIEVSTTSVQSGERVEFRVVDTSDNGAWIENLEWDFGDGTTASGWWNAHSYSSSGTYTVTLTATDQRGRQSTDQVQITVS